MSQYDCENSIEIQGIEKEIEFLEKEMNNSEWARGWEIGREDALKALKNSLFPSDERILKSAEIAFKILSKQLGSSIEKVFAGYNHQYDEPEILVVLSDDADELCRCKVIDLGLMLELIFQQIGLLTISILSSRLSKIDMDTVNEDFPYERIA